MLQLTIWSVLAALPLAAAQFAPLMLDNVAILPVSGRSDVNPNGWGDSYSVGTSCYCATSYDHDIDVVVVSTPLGARTVRQVCELLGPGPGDEGRPRYNDIQCGNGPANNAGDEDTCPGRIEYGQAGCAYIGPKWNWDGLNVPAPVPAPIPVPIAVPVAVPTPVQVPVPVPTPAPLAKPIPVIASIPEAPTAPILIVAADMSGPSFTVAGSNKYYGAPSGTVASGTSGFEADLFRFHRWSSTWNDFIYTVTDLEPGSSHTVTLGFAEVFSPNCATGKRVFGIQTQGEMWVESLDVYSLAGCNTAYTLSQTVSVSNAGTIEIGFLKINQNPFVSFIQVVSL